MSGPIAIPHRGDLGWWATDGVARPGQTAPIRVRSGSAGISTLNVPMPLGQLQGGAQQQRMRDNPWTQHLGNDYHCTDPAIVKSVAVPRRGQYGSDVHPTGPLRAGGQRGYLDENEYHQVRRGPAVDENIHRGLPGGGHVEVGWALGHHADPDEYTPRRPYYDSDYGPTHYQPPTQYSQLVNGVISAISDDLPADPGKFDRRRYDSAMTRQMFGNTGQRFLPPTRGRFQRYGKRWLSRSTGTVRPQMIAGPGHVNQLMMIPPAQSMGEQSQYLEVMGA